MMTLINFSLSPASAIRLHDALACLAKFSEYVSLEARAQSLVLSALNLSKSAYVAFHFDETLFFIDYHYVPNARTRAANFTCQILNKALLAIFKSRLTDSRNGASTLEKCEVELYDADDNSQATSRLNFKMICSQGVTKIHRLNYETVDGVHALFDDKRANNRWRIQSSWLKEYLDYFGIKTEQLDFCSENGRLTLTSYTEKVTNGREILKQPLETAVSIDLTDFEESNVQELMHIAINVKDFRNMVLHADTMSASVTALYMEPGLPLKFLYKQDGMHCEFTLMTIGDYRPSSDDHESSKKTASEPKDRTRSVSTASLHRDAHNMPPPLRRVAAPPPMRTPSQLGSRTNGSALQPIPVHAQDSLFVPEQEDDAQWAPAEGEDDDMIGWHHNTAQDPDSFGTFRDSHQDQRLERSRSDINLLDDAMAPTQRASQVRGLFD